MSAAGRWQRQAVPLSVLATALLAWWALVVTLPDGEMGRTILLELRLPRVVLALVSGAALALAGLWLQTLFRHGLVEPGLLGVTSGASLMAVLTLVLLHGWVWALPLGAFAGAMLALALVLALARHYRLEPESLLLAGIALNAVMAATTQLLLMLSADVTLRAGSFWLMGSFSYADWHSLLPTLGLVILLLLWGLRRASAFDLWLLGERDAGHLGLPVPRFRRQVIWASAVLVALVVAQAGSVAFIGLMAPHLAARLVGQRHAVLMPVTVWIGALLALFADTLAQRLMAPLELPVGVVTALLGGPAFLFLLQRRWRS